MLMRDMVIHKRDSSRWRVAVTRDENSDGPLSRALRAEGLEPVHCPVVETAPPADIEFLHRAANTLEQYDWIVFANQRAVATIVANRQKPWPRGVPTAAVGRRTAAALIDAGADPAPVVAPESGADALWAALEPLEDWRGKRVLLPAVEGGRRSIVDGLIAAGANVTVVEAYRMRPCPPDEIARRWRELAPDVAVVASPSAAKALVDAIGRDALASLPAIITIGPTTAAAFDAQGIRSEVSPEADFTAVARLVAERCARSGAMQRQD